MSKIGAVIGVVIAIIAITVIALYTNIFDLVKPTIDQSVDSAKEVITPIKGKDVVSGAEKIYSGILNETSKIEIKNPLP